MKRKNKKEMPQNGIIKQSQPTLFELIMNWQCDMRSASGLEPLQHWKQTCETPGWTKNICRKFCGTIFRPILKLRLKGKLNWRYYGRCIGLLERYKTYLAKDLPQTIKAEGLDNVSAEKWKKIQPLLGEEQARQYFLKILKRPAEDNASLSELTEIILQRVLTNLENQKQTAFNHLANQDAKTVKIFLKGMSEGYTTFLNETGEFSADDRRADIHLELIAWQYDIEKMRKFVLPKTRNHLISELKKLPEFKTRTHDWFKDVFKDIHLSIGRRGRPPKYAQASF